MTTRNESGFTLVEVIIAIVILMIGVIALMGASAMVSRMIGSGRHSTQAVEVATRRLENLRTIAYSTDPPCTAGTFTSGTASGTGYTETWTVANSAGSTVLRTVRDSVQYQAATGPRSVVLETRIVCR